MVQLRQGSDGLHWLFQDGLPELHTASDGDSQRWATHIRQHGVVFYAHPSHHHFAWGVPETVPNGALRQAILHRAFSLHKHRLTRPLLPLLERLDAVYREDSWLRAAAHQQPSQLWKHDNGLSDYQVWTAYRVATKQLNFYHAGRVADPSCRALPTCHGVPETSRHVFWDCKKARACWAKFISRWIDASVSSAVVDSCLSNCANRQAPAIPAFQRSRLLERFHDDAAAGATVWRRIWFLMCSICITHL